MTTRTAQTAGQAGSQVLGSGQPGVTKSVGCCGPEEQSSCCAPAAKASCCGTPEGQGCGCR